MKNSKLFLPSSMYYQTGFTLIELMISLVLGLLISAAVVQIYLTNVRTSSVQKSGSELQDASVFGLQMLETHIRLANLGNAISKIDDTTLRGGVVLTSQNFGLSIKDFKNPELLTHSAGDSGWVGISNTNVPSDQLTIQFTNLTGRTLSDCEGNDIYYVGDPDPTHLDNTVIERYFLRPSTTDTGTGVIKNLVLACDAGRIAFNPNGVPIGIKTFSGSDQRNFGQAGQEFILNVDQFKVLLGVTTGGTSPTLQYMSSNAYNALTTTKPYITSIKIGMIVHGTTPIVGNDDKTDFTLLGQNNVLKKDDARKKQVRTTYESTALLRNARALN